MPLALANSNRYPRRNEPRRSVPDTRRTRGLPAPLPHQRKGVRVKPANQSNPAKPAIRVGAARLARLALRGTRIARLSNPIALVAGEILDDILEDVAPDPHNLVQTRKLAAPNGAWTLRTDCPSRAWGDWWQTQIPPVGSPCTGNQFMEFNGEPESHPHHHTSPENFIAAHPSTLNVGVWDVFQTFGVWRGNAVRSFTRASGTSASPAPKWAPAPVPQTLPWPKAVPVPEPHELPVGFPRPNLPRWVRGQPKPHVTAETYVRTARGATPGGRNPHGGIRGKPKPRKNRDDLDNPQPSDPGTTELKGSTANTPAGRLVGNVVGSLKGRVGHGLGVASEIADLVAALHGALPDEIRAGSTSPDDMLMDLIRSGHRLDPQKAMTAVLLTLVVDDIVGRGIGRAERNWIRGGLNRATQPGATNRDVNNFVESLAGYY